jgi:hypothetical protein
MIKKLMIFERKILKRIFGPTKEKDRTWRIKTSEELDHLIKYNNRIDQIRAQRLSWFGHVHRCQIIGWSRKYINVNLLLQDYKEDLTADGMTMLNKTSVN